MVSANSQGRSVGLKLCSHYLDLGIFDGHEPLQRITGDDNSQARCSSFV